MELAAEGDRAREAAEGYLRKALEADPAHEDALFLRASLLLREGDREGALDLLRGLDWRRNAAYWKGGDAARLTPHRFTTLVRALRLRGSLLEGAGDFNAAGEAYYEAWEVAGSADVPPAAYEELSLALARVPAMQLHQGQPAAALAFYRRFLVDPPRNLPAGVGVRLARAFAASLSSAVTASQYTRHVSLGDGGGAPPPPRAPATPAAEALLLLLLHQERAEAAVRSAPSEVPSLSSAAGGGVGDDTESVLSSVSPRQLIDKREREVWRLVRAARADHLARWRATVEREDAAARLLLEQLLVRTRNFEAMAALCRRGLSVSLDSARAWYKLALALTAARQFHEAYLAVRQSLQRDSNSVDALLAASKLCLNYLPRVREAVSYSERALALARRDGGDGDAIARRAVLTACLLVHGVACSKYAYHAPTYALRSSLQRGAVRALEEAREGSPGNHRVVFYLALVRADTRSIPEALQLARRALELSPGHARSWVLLALLLSARKQFDDALRACENGLLEAPGSAAILITKARILNHTGDFAAAVAVYAELARRLFVPLGGGGGGGGAVAEEEDPAAAGRAGGEPVDSAQQCPLGFTLERVRVPSPGTSTAAAAAGGQAGGRRVWRPSFGLRSPAPAGAAPPAPAGGGRRWWEATNRGGGGDVLSSMVLRPDGDRARASSRAQVEGPGGSQWGLLGGGGRGADEQIFDRSNDPFGQQCELLLALSELCASCRVGDPSEEEALLGDAIEYALQARELGALAYLPDINARLGLYCWQLGRSGEAVRHYEAALAIDSNHVPSLIGLGTIENQRAGGSVVLAYGYLTSALQIDATSHHAWYEMGLVLQHQEKHEAATAHLATALELEREAPVQSFASVRRTV